jgi:RNA 3'-terminal phosphate cyclase (ATP)
MPQAVVDIDGSIGEGGGQILRTAAALAVALGKPVRVRKVRAGRSRPGLRPQHVTALRAAAAICGGELRGADENSTEIELSPGEILPGEYTFDIGTAGSASLVLQTLLPPLLLAQGDSRVTVVGGTHNPFAPPFEFLRDVIGPLLSSIGATLFFEMERAGFYPAGGGHIVMNVRGLPGASR